MKSSLAVALKTLAVLRAKASGTSLEEAVRSAAAVVTDIEQSVERAVGSDDAMREEEHRLLLAGVSRLVAEQRDSMTVDAAVDEVLARHRKAGAEATAALDKERTTLGQEFNADGEVTRLASAHLFTFFSIL